MEAKGSPRAVGQAEITLTGLRVPQAWRLPGATSFKDAGRVLAGTGNTVAWAALARPPRPMSARWPPASQRRQFGQAAGQLPARADKLVKMLAEVCSMQLSCLRLGRLIEEGKLTDTIAALAKMTTTPRPARSSPRPATCSAATASCWSSPSCGTWPTSRPSTPSRAPRPSRP
jgi:glutaryl-CoA dehydrogenase